MKKAQFKTTINCGGCIQTMTPILNEIVGTNNWSVDTTTADKILTIENENVDTKQLLEAVKEAGFNIELV